MKLSSRPPRTPSKLSDAAHHQLNLYALAASAAGVSFLALAQASEAEIIYTKTHHVIGRNGIYPIDLNHDGTIDFLINNYQIQGSQSQSHCFSDFLLVNEAYKNAVVVTTTGEAAALKMNVRIGQGRRFRSATSFGQTMAFYGCSSDGSCFFGGPWKNVNYRYLGLRFQIGGQTHYAWARLNVVVGVPCKITATLTGYAYETIAGKAIFAGQTNGEPDDEIIEFDTADPGAAKTPANNVPISLGELALGAHDANKRRR